MISEIKKSGPIPFSDYMARCLYHPELGYYARPEAVTVSKEGDFITSVSVGPLFGKLLACRLSNRSRFLKGPLLPHQRAPSLPPRPTPVHPQR